MLTYRLPLRRGDECHWSLLYKRERARSQRAGMAIMLGFTIPTIFYLLSVLALAR